MMPGLLSFDSGHLIEALNHFNEGLDRLDNQRSEVDVFDVIFRGLNKLQTGRLRAETELTPVKGNGEVAGFVELVNFATRTERSRARFVGSELRALAGLEPQVMDHHKLRGPRYRPGSSIEPDLLRKATEKHRKLVNAIGRLDSEAGSDETIHQIIDRAAELLYIVRSNIVHGEKTPYGPDLSKRKRDENVCLFAIPLCEVLVDLLLEEPSHRLVAYGTLAPGRVNHSIIESLDGQWHECSLEGTLTERAGLPVLLWQPWTGTLVEAMLLESDDLPDHWQRLDAFEGIAYRRRLVPVSVPNQDGSHRLVVASAYVGVQDR